MDLETLRTVLAPMEGWCDPEKALDLAQTAISENAQVIVEIGVFGGKSLLALALAAQEKGSGTVHGIDPWTKEPCLEDESAENKEWWASIDLEEIFKKAQAAVSDNKCDAFTEINRATSIQAWKDWPDQDKIDLLHIDGNHAEWSSCTDVILWLPLVRPGGLVFLDDYDWVSLEPARRLVERKCTLLRTAKHPQTHYAVYRKN